MDSSVSAQLIRLAVVRMTEFWALMDEQFGRIYARSLAVDYRLPALGATAAEAIEGGVPPKRVWQAVCAEFEVPANRRL